MFEKLKEILNAYFDSDLPEFALETALSDLGLSSMDLFEVVCLIEERFGVSIPDSMLQKLVTVGDVVEYLEQAGQQS